MQGAEEGQEGQAHTLSLLPGAGQLSPHLQGWSAAQRSEQTAGGTAPPAAFDFPGKAPSHRKTCNGQSVQKLRLGVNTEPRLKLCSRASP